MKSNCDFTQIPIFHACSNPFEKDDAPLKAWIQLVLADHQIQGEVGVKIVDEKESQALNKKYRGKNNPTNVLSFPMALEAALPIPDLPIGDLVICAPVVAKEASAQSIPLLAHYAHMVVHGTLHLLGYQHENEKDASVMEQKEINYLKHLGFHDPYGETTHDE